MAEPGTIPTQAATDLSTFTILINGEETGPETGIESIMVIKAVNKIPVARISILDGSVPARDFEISNGPDFVPGAEIEIVAGYHSEEDPIFKGIITSHSIKAKEGKPGRLIVEAKDVAVKMTIGRKSRLFEDESDKDIIENILNDYELEKNIESTDVTHASMIQHHVTDWDFMVMRAEANGKLVFVNDGTITVSEPDLESEPVAELTYGENIFEFEAVMDARDQYGAVKSTAWNIANQEMVEEISSAPEFEEQGNLDSDSLSAVAGPRFVVMQHSGKIPENELKAWADAKLLRSRLSKIKGRVKTIGFASVRPGNTISLQGFGDRFNGDAFVSSVAHKVTNNTNWTTEIEFGLDKNFFVENYDDITEKPAGGLLPSVHGLQTGLVTEISDDPENDYRIKVRLFSLNDDDKSVWARQATLDAGNDRGFVFRPEPGDEVVVGFINDDPREPVILGALNSRANPAHIDAEEANNVKGIKTKNGIKLIFDDEKRSVTIETPGGNKIVVDDDAEAIKIEDSNGNKADLTSDGITMESASDLNIKATGDVNIEGINISVKAQTQFKAEGGAGAEMSSSGQAVVKGSIVKIN